MNVFPIDARSHERRHLVTHDRKALAPCDYSEAYVPIKTRDVHLQVVVPVFVLVTYYCP